MIHNIKNGEQVKSKKRVADHGEVFTNEREVNAMLDLVKHETERIDARFLEPACGNGNFLAVVLQRKLAVVDSRYHKSQVEWERYAALAVSSIYGVDILEDNTLECKARLFSIFSQRYSALFDNECKDECADSIRFILNRNILWGDALDLKHPVTKVPIVFSEWSFVANNNIKRRDFELYKLLLPRNATPNTLFSDLGETAFIPDPIKTYPLINFLKLGNDATNHL